MSPAAAEAGEPINRPGGELEGPGSPARWAIWSGLAALLLFAFWPLFSFDPREGVMRATQGIEGVLFEPTGEDPRLIAVLAGWMLFTRRGRLAAAWRNGPGAPVLGAGLLAGALAVAGWATWVAAPDLLIQALQLFLLGAAAMLGGRAGLRAVWLPVAFLLLAMPPPAALLNAVMLPLQLATVQACAQVLQAFGFEAWGVGDELLMRRGIFHVIETCSGVRLVQTLVMASVVYAELFRRRAPRALVLLVAAPILGLVVNFVRILSIVFNPYGSISSVHTTQGVAMVVLGVLLLAGLDRGLERLWPAPLRPGAERTSLLAQRPDARLATASLALVAVAAWVWLGPQWAPPANDRVPIWRLPQQIDGLHANGKPLDLVFLGSVHFSDRLYTTYSTSRPGRPAPPDAPDRRPIDLLLGEDDHLNRRGSLLSDKTAYPGRGWQLAGRGEVEIEAGRKAELLLFHGTGLKGASPRYMTIHWREGFGTPGGEAMRAFLGLDRSAFARGERALVWQVGTGLGADDDLTSARDELLGFARAAREAWAQVESSTRSGGE